MKKVVLSREAQKDLLAIRNYIRDELSDPDAARHTLSLLRQSIESLADLPERGTPLDTVLPVHTAFRYLLCKHYRVFYLVGADTVEVVRILHNLQDYMRALFM